MTTNIPRPACLKFRLCFVALLSIAASFAAHSTTCFAQAAQAQPVARLLSNSVVNAVSRPRRVGHSVPANSVVEPAPLSIDEATTIERTAFDKTNEAREQNGLPPLVWDGVLCRMAREHSKDMAERGYFAHETPEGLAPKDRSRTLGVRHFKVLAENIAYNKGFEDPGGFAVQRWMNSGGHRANILYTGFQASATGSFIAADGSVYLTQVFIAR